jgi:hypothetical protein
MTVTVLRNRRRFVAGIVVVGILVVAVELLSGIVHPLPDDFDGSIEGVREHVALYPHWVLAVAVVAWGHRPGRHVDGRTVGEPRELRDPWITPSRGGDHQHRAGALSDLVQGRDSDRGSVRQRVGVPIVKPAQQRSHGGLERRRRASRR